MKRSLENLHSHTIYCDGKNTVQEMVESAIDRGFTTLGFSGHGYYVKDSFTMNEERETKYIQDVLKAKEQYKDQIHIYLGIEEELDGKQYSKDTYDFVIGSMHTLHFSVDESKEIMQQEVDMYYDHDFLKYAKAFYEKVEKYAQREEADIIGHLDLLMKFNEDESFCKFDDSQYLSYAYHTIDVLVKAGKIFEINTGAMARGYRTKPYPHELLLRHIYEQGGKICINSDCHNKDFLDCGYDVAYRLAREAGFTTKMVLTPDGFKEIEL